VPAGSPAVIATNSVTLALVLGLAGLKARDQVSARVPVSVTQP